MAQVADWSVYLIRCGDGSLYTGIATDVAQRLEQHRAADGKGAKYLRGRGPLSLSCECPVGERGLALRIESRIKRMRRQDKERLARGEKALAEFVEAVRVADDG